MNNDSTIRICLVGSRRFLGLFLEGLAAHERVTIEKCALAVNNQNTTDFYHTANRALAKVASSTRQHHYQPSAASPDDPIGLNSGDISHVYNDGY